MTRPAEAESYTRDGFRALLATALAAGYAFVSFDAADASAERVCLLRHDVDADLGAALELAEIEAEARVRATYFLMLRSPLYNLFGRANHRIAETIVGLGHWLGLHYDPAFPSGARDASEAVALEARILSDEFGVPVRAVSFHQPASAEGVAEVRPPGLVSAFDLPGFRYVSDANKVVACGELFRLFRERRHDRIQLLVHPLWWATDDGGLAAERLWERAILANLERTQEQLTATERAYGAARAFRIEPEAR